MALLRRRRKPKVDKVGNVSRLGLERPGWNDLYHDLLTMSVPALLGFVAVAYLSANMVFAALYVLVGGVANARPDSLADMFFFSIQTMATIGYGNMYPVSFGANLLATAEVVFGLLTIALFTGVMFARISRPTAKVMFSEVAVIAPVNGIPTLAFRVANQRRNRIVEAQVSVSVLREEVTLEGASLRRFHDLSLLRSRTPIFALTWTVMHPIDAQSPLYGLDHKVLAEEDCEFICSLTGLDDISVQTVHVRHVYEASDIRWGARFVDIFQQGENGEWSIDYERFHDTEAVPVGHRGPVPVRPGAT
ncbi:MAG TPA: ion channel [Stellaceae bacterium]|nr:ion channel [Stellaceae bacterium]